MACSNCYAAWVAFSFGVSEPQSPRTMGSTNNWQEGRSHAGPSRNRIHEVAAATIAPSGRSDLNPGRPSGQGAQRAYDSQALAGLNGVQGKVPRQKRAIHVPGRPPFTRCEPLFDAREGWRAAGARTGWPLWDPVCQKSPRCFRLEPAQAARSPSRRGARHLCSNHCSGAPSTDRLRREIRSHRFHLGLSCLIRTPTAKSRRRHLGNIRVARL